MKKDTTMLIRKENLRNINKIQSQMEIELNGVKLTRDEAIEALCMGFRNSKFNVTEHFREKIEASA